MEHSVELSVRMTLEGGGGVMLEMHSKQAYWTYLVRNGPLLAGDD